MITPVLEARRWTRIGSVDGLGGGGPVPAEPDDLVVAERVRPHPQQRTAVEVVEHDRVGLDPDADPAAAEDLRGMSRSIAAADHPGRPGRRRRHTGSTRRAPTAVTPRTGGQPQSPRRPPGPPAPPQGAAPPPAAPTTSRPLPQSTTPTKEPRRHHRNKPRTDQSVKQLPERLSRRNRNRVSNPSTTYRNPTVKHEPEPHTVCNGRRC